MDGASSVTVGNHIAVALAAGTIATKGTSEKEAATTAIHDRYQALKRAVTKKSDETRVRELDEDPASEEHRTALAKELDEHGAGKDRDVVTTAKELLGLIKVDDAARTAVGELLSEVEAALVELSKIDVEPSVPAVAPGAVAAKAEVPARPSSGQVAAADSKRELPPSRRIIPPDEPSKTEIERTALPLWKRTERFWMKAGVLAVGYVVVGLALYLLLRKPPSEMLEKCREGDKAKCWQVVGDEDAIDQGKKVSEEPLRLLCDKHQDPCACAGLAYVNAAEAAGHSSQCALLVQASSMDPKWPCTCKRYDFWRWGQMHTVHCETPRCQ